MAFAIIKTGGKQYKAVPGETLTIEKIDKPAKGNTVTFEEVLLVDDGKATKLGKAVGAIKVTASIVSEGKGKKLHIIKFKPKSNYKKKIGHRQPFTKVKIGEIK
jgi:large subunit ribosomal protein L21